MKSLLFRWLLVAIMGCAIYGCAQALAAPEKQQAEGFSISLKTNDQTSGWIKLAIQYGADVSIIDSLQPNVQGVILFTGQEMLSPGQYMFIQNERRLFNFLISFTEYVNLQFTANVDNGRTIEVQAKDTENQAYIAFNRFLQDQYRKTKPATDGFAVIEHYTDSIAKRFPNTLLAILAQNVSAPPLPEYMALGDARIVHTSILPLRLKNFFTQVIPPDPEQIIPEVDKILNLATASEVKKFCGMFMLTYFLESNIMGMESVVVHIIRNYYLSGIIPIDNPELLADLRTYVDFNEKSLIGSAAPELDLPDINGAQVSLCQLPANYTILLFYDTDCEICKEVIPDIIGVCKKYDQADTKVYAVYTQADEAAWKQYAATLPQDWIQVWDPGFASGFHKLYNVTGTPKLFLLDKNKIILGRELSPAMLDQLLFNQTTPSK